MEAKPSFVGLKKGTPEYRAVNAAATKWQRQNRPDYVARQNALRRERYVPKAAVRGGCTSDGTMVHKTKRPTDDRPTYLRNENPMGYMLAVDTETDGTAWWDGARPFIATASDYDRDYLFNLANDKDCAALRTAYLAADSVVFHNAQFDVHMLAAAGVLTLDELLSRPIYDTYIMAKIVLGEGNMTGSHLGKFGLKELASHFVSADALEPERVMKQLMKDMGLITRADQKNLPDGVYKELWKVHPEVVETYAMKDTRYTYDLYMVLVDKMAQEQDVRKRDGHYLAVDIEHKVMPELIRMEHRGVALDREVVDELYDEYRMKLQNLECDLDEAAYECGVATITDEKPWNPDATKDVVALLEAHGVVITEVTEGGFIKTDKRTLEAYEDVPVVKLILDYRRTSKFLRTYLEAMKDRDTVHASFQQLGAWTHRMSCRRPNMQNIPVRDAESARLRQMFVPRPGYCFVVADYDRIEPTLLAWYMDDLELMDQFIDGDPYVAMGTEHYGTDDQSKWKLPRSKIKNAFLALTYSVGIEKLAGMLECTKDEAKAIKQSIERLLGPAYSNAWYKDEADDWQRTYPGFPDGFVQHARKRIKRNGKQAGSEPGYVVTIGGSTHRIDPDKHYVAPNTVIQGGAAYIMKVGLARAASALRAFDGHPVLVVHDEIVAEVPVAVAAAALAVMEEAMRSAASLAPNGKLRLATTGATCYNGWHEAK